MRPALDLPAGPKEPELGLEPELQEVSMQPDWGWGSAAVTALLAASVELHCEWTEPARVRAAWPLHRLEPERQKPGRCRDRVRSLGHTPRLPCPERLIWPGHRPARDRPAAAVPGLRFGRQAPLASGGAQYCRAPTEPADRPSGKRGSNPVDPRIPPGPARALPPPGRFHPGTAASPPGPGGRRDSRDRPAPDSPGLPRSPSKKAAN